MPPNNGCCIGRIASHIMAPSIFHSPPTSERLNLAVVAPVGLSTRHHLGGVARDVGGAKRLLGQIGVVQLPIGEDRLRVRTVESCGNLATAAPLVWLDCVARLPPVSRPKPHFPAHGFGPAAHLLFSRAGAA